VATAYIQGGILQSAAKGNGKRLLNMEAAV